MFCDPMRILSQLLNAQIVLTLNFAPCPILAQEAGLVVGQVRNAAGQALPGVDVEVLGSYWGSVTDQDGRFRLRLPDGSWSLRFALIGYRPDTLAVVVGDGPRRQALEVRLIPEPIQLRGLSVDAPGTPPLAQTVTVETVRQVPPLGEPDVFRAVVLLPGISQPNDLKGRIHLAGGASDETGVRLDGHPLQDPFHLLGIFGAFNVAALGRADVLIHHLPPSIGGRLSGEIDLETRSPEGKARVEGVFSLLSTGVTASLPERPAGVDVLVSGRITYLERVAPLISSDIPLFGFHDALVRLGRSWNGAWRTEVLAFHTHDRFRDRELSGFRGYEPLTWGESLVGARVRRDGARWSLAARASFNRASVNLDERVGMDGSNHIDSRRDWVSGALSISRTDRRWRIEAGAGFDRRTNRQEWIARELADEIFSPNTPEEFRDSEDWSAASVFAEGQLELGDRWVATAGARLWSADELRLAPRLHLAFRASNGLELSTAYDRRYQFDTQLEEPVEGSVSPPLFLLDSPREADVLAVAARLRPSRLPLGARATFDVQAFRKTYRNRTLLAELPIGATRRTMEVDFPDFERIRGRSTGAALGGRVELESGFLIQGSYTWQRVREFVDGAAYPTAWDAPHTVSFFASRPLLRQWTFNVVFQAHSGRATTPVLARIYEPDVGGAWHRVNPRYLRGDRNSLRIPPYRRLDIGVRREARIRDADVTLALQVLNLLARDNPIDYDWTQYFRSLEGGRASPGRTGLPIIPSIGVEVRW